MFSLSLSRLTFTLLDLGPFKVMPFWNQFLCFDPMVAEVWTEVSLCFWSLSKPFSFPPTGLADGPHWVSLVAPVTGTV